MRTSQTLRRSGQFDVRENERTVFHSQVHQNSGFRATLGRYDHSGKFIQAKDVVTSLWTRGRLSARHEETGDKLAYEWISPEEEIVVVSDHLGNIESQSVSPGEKLLTGSWHDDGALRYFHHEFRVQDGIHDCGRVLPMEGESLRIIVRSFSEESPVEGDAHLFVQDLTPGEKRAKRLSLDCPDFRLHEVCTITGLSPSGGRYLLEITKKGFQPAIQFFHYKKGGRSDPEPREFKVELLR